MKSWQDIMDMAAAHQHVRVAAISCSKLDALADCPLFDYEQSDPGPALRGTALHIIMGMPEADWPLDMPVAEYEAAMAAKHIEYKYVREPILRDMVVGGGLYDFGGTLDVFGLSLHDRPIVADYKFGDAPVSSDSLQLIAYALLAGATSTMVIQPGRVPMVHEITDEDSGRLVNALRSARGDEPTTCDRCGSCTRRDTCPALRRDLAVVETILDPKTIALPESPDECGRLMDQLSSAEVVCEILRERIKSRLVAGGDVTGWKTITSKKQSTAWKKLAEEKCSPEDIAAATTVNEVVSMRRTKR